MAADVRKLDEIEMDYILAVLERVNGNQTQAAKMLGIGTTTLYRKLRHHVKGGDSKYSAQVVHSSVEVTVQRC